MNKLIIISAFASLFVPALTANAQVGPNKVQTFSSLPRYTLVCIRQDGTKLVSLGDLDEIHVWADTTGRTIRVDYRRNPYDWNSAIISISTDCTITAQQ